LDPLTVVAYNVSFGDALLILIPERTRGRTVMRSVLVDVGNVLAGPGSDAQVFTTVLEDVRRRLNRRPIDLYVMTHAHMDHVQGLARAHHDGCSLPPIDYAWLTASADSTYYERFPEARRQRRIALAAYDRIQRIALQRGLLRSAPVRAFLDNNNPRSTDACVAFLSKRARRKTSFVYRGFRPIAGKNHPFREAIFSIWAPEHDTSAYYGRTRPVAPAGRKSRRTLKAPPGVSQEALDALVEYSRSGLGDEMLAIDRAANNTSVVFLLEWRGWRLLFTGDAELRSWHTMQREVQLRPVHFLKVGHHASHNGTPPEALMDVLLPLPRPDDRRRSALISTCKDIYSGVPDRDTIARLRRRVDHIYLTNRVPIGEAVEIEFDPTSSSP